MVLEKLNSNLPFGMKPYDMKTVRNKIDET